MRVCGMDAVHSALGAQPFCSWTPAVVNSRSTGAEECTGGEQAAQGRARARQDDMAADVVTPSLRDPHHTCHQSVQRGRSLFVCAAILAHERGLDFVSLADWVAVRFLAACTGVVSSRHAVGIQQHVCTPEKQCQPTSKTGLLLHTTMLAASRQAWLMHQMMAQFALVDPIVIRQEIASGRALHRSVSASTDAYKRVHARVAPTATIAYHHSRSVIDPAIAAAAASAAQARTAIGAELSKDRYKVVMDHVTTMSTVVAAKWQQAVEQVKAVNNHSKV